MNFNSLEELKAYLEGELLFTHEATKYLGISSQRLHQLVQNGKITPLKSSKSGSVFLKSDLYNRNFETEMKYKNNTNQEIQKNFTVETFNDAANYYTLLALFKNKFKKCNPMYIHIETQMDVKQPIENILNSFIEVTGFDKESILFESTLVRKGLNSLEPSDYIVKIGDELYPKLLEKTDQAPMFLFMRGNPNLLKFNIVSVVGTRNPSKEGAKKAYILAEKLGKNRVVVASGLAKGIDENAHLAALDNSNPTISVIGTPLTKYYPKQNKEIQKNIEEQGLVISQFPPSANVHRWNFPMRNAVMSGISLATVVIEAGETSGSLIQADYALKQNRLVFIPQSAVEKEDLHWPKKYISRKGAHSFSNIEALFETLANYSFNKSLETENQTSLNVRGGTVNYVSKNKNN